LIVAANAADIATSAGNRRIAVAGNPNSGKTSVFNQLSGLRQKVGNYPGVTVEKREALLAGANIVLLDLPGTYSLSARSPDEEIARDVLLGRVKGMKRPDAVLLVIDACNLERNLYLASQILEFGAPVVIACNMMDVAERRGVAPDCAALAGELGVPIIPTVASEGRGIAELRQALEKTDSVRPVQRPWHLPPPFEQAIDTIARAMEASGEVPPAAVRAGAMLWIIDYLSGEQTGRLSAERFLGRLSAQHADILRQAADAVANEVEDPAGVAIERRYAWISEVAARSTRPAQTGAVSGRRRKSTTDQIDRILTHRVGGLLVFAVVMFVLFLSIFSWAEPLMGFIEAGEAALAGWVSALLPDGPLRSLVVDGGIKGVGAVIVFFPQICILFLFLSVLEDSGYMARAAFIMDRLMSRVGLHGKSFIPLLSCYACAIPGILATRTIEHRRDRLTTIMVAPFMSCSARLPVYIIVIAATFGDRTWLKAGVMFGMYALGTVTALAMALLFKKTLLAGPRPTFIMELPPYHLPQVAVIARAVWDRSRLFLTGAGTTIFAVCVIIWALSYFPRLDEAGLSPASRAEIGRLRPSDDTARQNIIEGERLRRSYLGRLGHLIEPAIRPLGFDWRIGTGVLSSFFAREVFVSTMGITFAVGETDETSQDLREQLAGAAWPDGRTVLTPLVGVGLMVFYVLACQCVSTLAVVRKETGSWRWPALMFGYMTVLAYVASLAVYQVGSSLGWGS
jgi:ferrous iron transport protein B